MQTNPMKDSDEWLDTILDLYRRDIERHYGGRTVGKTLTGEEAKAAIQAHYQPQAAGDVPSVMELMVQISKYWTTATGEPELKEFAEYVQGIIKERQHPND